MANLGGGVVVVDMDAIFPWLWSWKEVNSAKWVIEGWNMEL